MGFHTDFDGHTYTVTETGPVRTVVTRFSVPRLKFRIIRGERANWKVVYYATKEKRDERAQHFADIDGQSVICELWEDSTARNADPINQGWACDNAMSPQ